VRECRVAGGDASWGVVTARAINAYCRIMKMRCLTVLVMACSGLILPATGVAADEPAICGGRIVTIDLNDPAAPDPYRDSDDVVRGTPGNDTIETGGGKDWICGGAGRDTIDGGDGPDTLYGGDGADALRGRDGADTIYGGPGADGLSLRGDVLADAPESAYGGPGNDVFYAAADEELFAGGPGSDTVTFRIQCRECGDEYPYPNGGVRVDLRLHGPQHFWGNSIHEFSGIENLIGTGYDDVLLGDGERNRLDGFYGDDIINGRRGADYLIGWIGDDIINGGRGADNLIGGIGTDHCIGGPGRDHFQDCE
jgi:Ca2+-binding RTX toxin-like protein